MLRAFFLALCLSLGLNLPAVADDVPPDVLARTTSQEVLAVLKADKDIQRGDLSKIYELVEAKVLPNFDFNRMTQLAMGRHWPKASAQQKQVLVAEFRNLLVRTYATSLTEFGGQSVEFKNFSMKPDDTEVVVRSEIRQPGGQPISIDYSMYKTAFGWKVYDVTIDNVSLVTNYRATFANSIRQSGIDGLIKTLSAQSAKGGSKPAPAKPATRSGS
jgi:phospholipid transport system substrate-binding protein